LKEAGKRKHGAIELRNAGEPVVTSEMIRQFVYCKRIPFFREVMNFYPRRTTKMKYSQTKHAELQEKKKKRQGVEDRGGLYFDVKINDREKNWIGVMDEIEIFEDDGTGMLKATVTEYKFGKVGKKMAPHHEAQLGFQAMLLERNHPLKVKRIGVFNPETGEKVAREMTDEIRTKTYKLVAEYTKTVTGEDMPPPARDERKCVNCEYWIACLRA